MSRTKNTDAVRGDKALELTMRDVLGGLDEFATMVGYEAYCDTFEIVSIEPLQREAPTVIPVPRPAAGERRTGHPPALRLIA